MRSSTRIASAICGSRDRDEAREAFAQRSATSGRRSRASRGHRRTCRALDVASRVLRVPRVVDRGGARGLHAVDRDVRAQRARRDERADRLRAAADRDDDRVERRAPARTARAPSVPAPAITFAIVRRVRHHEAALDARGASRPRPPRRSRARPRSARRRSRASRRSSRGCCRAARRSRPARRAARRPTRAPRRGCRASPRRRRACAAPGASAVMNDSALRALNAFVGR